MTDIQRRIVKHSVDDVIRILENVPVRRDMIPEINALQAMNRASMAHLSIERAIKFLITEAGGSFLEEHNLRDRYRELLQHDVASSEFLEEAFEAAVHHFRYNYNLTDLKHLKNLERYLEITGSDKVFQDIRYWELKQLTDEAVLHHVCLPIHVELLYALSELLLPQDLPKQIVADRVEEAVGQAMWQFQDLAYGPGTPKERSVNAYIKWRQGFNTWSEALADAVRKGFNLGDDLMADITRNAYRTLISSSDLAVSYFASTLDVLPKQPRDVIPCVEWANPDEKRIGAVKTPAGTILGLIERSHDKLWHITPLLGVNGVSSKADNQTDARCYLAQLFTRYAFVTVGGEERSLRIVGEGYAFFVTNYDEIIRQGQRTSDQEIWTHKLAFWGTDHEIETNDALRVKVLSNRSEGVVDKFEGIVTRVEGHEVYLSGSHVIDFEGKDRH